jgi:hypothetical protein
MEDKIEGIDYVRYCIYQAKITNEQRDYLTKPRKGNWLQEAMRNQTTVKKVKPDIPNKLLIRYINRYGEFGFKKLPKWLQTQIKIRSPIFKRRSPTEIEMWDTVSDAREHRIINKQLTTQDYLDHYRGKKSYATF